jgi:hypothetical protein
MLLDFFVKGPKSIIFKGDCIYQFRKSNRRDIGFSFMTSNSGGDSLTETNRVSKILWNFPFNRVKLENIINVADPDPGLQKLPMQTFLV